MVVINFDDGQKCSYDGYLYDMLNAFKLAVTKHNTSVVGLIDGRSGQGKSTLAVQCGKFWAQNDLHLYYDPQEFMKGLSEAKAESCHIFDEALIISNRSSLSEVNRMIIQAMSMIRSKRLYVIFCVNSIFDLDRNLVLSRGDFLLHVYGTLINRGSFCAYFKAAGDKKDNLKLLYLLGKKMYDYSKPRANFFGSFPKTFLVDESRYEADKQNAVNKFLRGETKGSMGKREESYKKLLAQILLYGKREHGVNLIDYTNGLGINKNKLSNLVIWAREQGYLKKIEGDKE